MVYASNGARSKGSSGSQYKTGGVCSVRQGQTANFQCRRMWVALLSRVWQGHQEFIRPKGLNPTTLLAYNPQYTSFSTCSLVLQNALQLYPCHQSVSAWTPLTGRNPLVTRTRTQSTRSGSIQLPISSRAIA